MKLVQVTSAAHMPGHYLDVRSIAMLRMDDGTNCPKYLGTSKGRTLRQYMHNKDCRKIKCTKKNLRAFAKQFR